MQSTQCALPKLYSPIPPQLVEARAASAFYAPKIPQDLEFLLYKTNIYQIYTRKIKIKQINIK